MKKENIKNTEFLPMPGIGNDYPHPKRFKYVMHHDLNIIKINGKPCRDEDRVNALLIEDIETHFDTKNNIRLRVYVRFDQLFSSTIKHLFKLIKLLNKYHQQGKDIKIFWSYAENEDMIDIGLDLHPFCQFPFLIKNV